jgi:peptide/nickel transport system substrate-binding protein
MRPMVVFSPEHYDMEKDEYFGTGPWKFVHWHRDEEILFEKNEDYWLEDEVPQVDMLSWKFYSSGTALALALKGGQIDIAYKTLPYSEVEELETTEGIEVISEPPLRTFTLQMNMKPEYAPMDELLVRKAIAYSVNRDELIEEVYPGHAEKLLSIIPISSPTYTPSYEKYEPRDVEKAKELLEQAGYPDGFTMPTLWITAKLGPEIEDYAVILQEQLAEANIELPIQLVEDAMASSERRAGRSPCEFSAWICDYFTEYQYLETYMLIPDVGRTRALFYGYNDTHAMDLVREAAQETDDELRSELYVELQEYAAETIPNIPLMQLKEYWAISDHVEGLNIVSPWWGIRFHDVTITK